MPNSRRSARIDIAIAHVDNSRSQSAVIFTMQGKYRDKCLFTQVNSCKQAKKSVNLYNCKHLFAAIYIFIKHMFTMANNASTKTISARIPMKDWVRFRQIAVDQKMSLNDFLTLKLYGKSFDSVESDKLANAEKEIEELTEALDSLSAVVKLQDKTSVIVEETAIILAYLASGFIEGNVSKETFSAAVDGARNRLKKVITESPLGEETQYAWEWLHGEE